MTPLIRSFYDECKYFIHSIGNPYAKRARETLENLKKLERSTKYQLQSLQLKKTTHWKALWRVIIKDAEQLRRNGHADLSLAVLNAAKDSGLTNPWIEASRARSYEELSEWPKALAIWDELRICNNKDVSKIAIKNLKNHPNKIKALICDLNTVIQLSGNETRFLPQTPPLCLQELEDPILAEVANLQKSKSLELSAKILKKSITAGLCTPTIKEKLASLLCESEQENEAIELWQSLQSSHNISVKKNADKMIRRMTKKFLNKIRTIIRNAGKPILHLPEVAPSTLSELESSIIKEADALRNAKSPDCSLQVLETSIKWGIHSDVIKAKKARTLLSMKKNNEAIILLTPLLDSKNKQAKKIAQNLLKPYPEETQKTKIDLKVKDILSKTKTKEKAIKLAIQMLTGEIMKDPQNKYLHIALQEVAIKQSTLNNQIDQSFEELNKYRREQAGLTAFVETLEKRSKND